MRNTTVVKNGGSSLSRRLASIDALRGLAALAVVFLHVPHNSPGGRLDSWSPIVITLDFGYVGVLLFLVISGFCIHLSVAGRMQRPTEAHIDWVTFWKKRFWRLYPPYLAAILFSLGLFLLTDPAVLHEDCQITSLPWDVGTHLLMVHNLFRRYCSGLGNGAFWTLGLEEQLYALYACFLFLRTRYSAQTTVAIGMIVTVAWRLATAWTDSNEFYFGSPPLELSKMGRWPFGYWGFWLLGAAAAEAYAGSLKLPRWCFSGRVAILLTVAGLLINARILGRFAGSRFLAAATGSTAMGKFATPFTEMSDVLFGVVCFILVNRWVREETVSSRASRIVALLAPLGMISYSLYLTHVPVLQVGETVFQRLGFGDQPWEHLVRYAVLLPLCLGVAFLFYYLVEQHFLNRHAKRRPTLVSADALPVPSLPIEVSHPPQFQGNESR